MKHLRALIYPLIATVTILQLSCKEEKVYPKVDILSPDQGHYRYGDTILVRATASEVNGNVSVSVLKGASIVNLPSSLVYQDGDEYEFEIYFDDKYLESGEYDIRVRAFNEGNGTSKFVKVFLEELEKRVRGVVALSVNWNTATLLKRDSASAITSLSLEGDYHYLSFSGRFDQIVVAPREEGELTSFSFNDLSENYTIPLFTSSGIRLYDGLIDINGYPNVLTSDGRIKSYGEQGNQIKSNLVDDLPALDAGRELDFYGDKIAVLSKQETDGFWKLSVIGESNRNVMRWSRSSGEGIDVEWYSNNNCIIAYSKQNNTIIARYDVESRTLTQLSELANTKGVDLEWIGTGMLLSTDNEIYVFDPFILQTPSLLYSQGANKMTYEALSGEVYYASDNTVYKAKPGSPWQYVMAYGGSMVDVEIAYNK